MVHRVPMPRGSLMLVALFAIGALSVFGFSHVMRTPSVRFEPLDSPRARVFRAAEKPESPKASTAQEGDTKPARTAEPSSDRKATVASLIVDAAGSDPSKRADAIVALGTAPREDALPVLENLLGLANDDDRALVFASLRTLARGQGDADERIRSAVRKVIYHGGDEAVTVAAQATLDGIEDDLSRSADRAKPAQPPGAGVAPP